MIFQAYFDVLNHGIELSYDPALLCSHFSNLPIEQYDILWLKYEMYIFQVNMTAKISMSH